MLFLGNLVEGKYSFTLTVTDSKGQTSTNRGTVEVKPGKVNRQTMDILSHRYKAVGDVPFFCLCCFVTAVFKLFSAKVSK